MDRINWSKGETLRCKLVEAVAMNESKEWCVFVGAMRLRAMY